MSAKTKIIVIRKSQLASALIILIIALLAAGLLISVIAARSGRHSQAETDTSASTTTDPTAIDSSAAASSDTGTSNFSTVPSGTSSETAAASSAAGSYEASVSASAVSALYIPGVYASTVFLNDTAMDVQVVVDANHINSISLVNLDESVETAYPLVQPAIEALSEQIISSQSIENVTYAESNQYTSMVLYSAICDALDKASI